MKFALEIDLASRAMQTNMDIAKRLRNLATIIRSQGVENHHSAAPGKRLSPYI